MKQEPEESAMTPDSPGEVGSRAPRAAANGNVSSAGFEFSKHPAVAPPGWDPTKTESGDGLNERRAVFVLQNVQNPLFVPMACGFNDAIHQYGWTGGTIGPSVGIAPENQLSLIETEIDQMEPGDVIVTTILDTTAYNDAIQRALDKGIVVVNGHTTPPTRDWNYETQQAEFTDTSPVTGEDRGMIIPHIGIRNERGGVAMAAEMYERLQEQNPDQDAYTVFLANDLPDNRPVTRRVDKAAANEGTAQRYFEAQDDVDIYEDQVFEAPQPPEIEESRAFVVDTIGGEDVDAVVASALWLAVGAGRAREVGNLPADLLVCGFDLAGMTGTGDDPGPIARGEVDFVVGQDMYSQGYASASTARIYLERGIPPKDLEWGVSVWDQRNVEFMTQRRSWRQLLEWQENNYEELDY